MEARATARYVRVTPRKVNQVLDLVRGHAVEEALKPLHGCAVARKQSGGKKPGLKDTMRRSMNDKDEKQAYVNSLWLFGRDPDNIAYIEGIVKNASRLRAEDAAKWAAGVCHKALDGNPKSSTKQYQTLTEQLEELGSRAAERDEGPFGGHDADVQGNRSHHCQGLWRQSEL